MEVWGRVYKFLTEHTHTDLHARARTRAHARTHARTYTHTHTHTHTHGANQTGMGLVRLVELDRESERD